MAVEGFSLHQNVVLLCGKRSFVDIDPRPIEQIAVFRVGRL
jgi:hypothetical protein